MNALPVFLLALGIAAPLLAQTETPPASESRHDELSSQFAVEVLVRDMRRSLEFYESLGFVRERFSGDFAVLRWAKGHYIFLSDHPDLKAPTHPLPVNVRLIVPDVDAAWERIRKLPVTIDTPLSDRSYGLREFSIRDPDGFGLRFATPLKSSSR